MRKKLTSILSAALALVLVLSALPVAALAARNSLNNFKAANTYAEETFADVNAGSWYTDNVKTAYELDLVKGVSDDKFNPDGNMTVAAALALACRLHSIYAEGEADFVQGSPWYQVYVDYAVENGIITKTQFTNYNANATRRQFAAILAKALPKTALTEKNTVEDGAIPDVAKGSANYDDIYLLYRAGILTGNDQKGTFTPETSIKRSAVAAIVSRMAKTDLRQKITLEKPAVEVTGISLNRSSLSLSVNGSETLTATIKPADADDKDVTWSSSRTSVAKVSSSGKVTGVAEGTATITAKTSNGKTATCTVTVKEIKVTSVSVSPSSLTLEEGESERLSGSVYPSDASDDDLSWKSSNTRVATVSGSGTVTAVAEGSATITATSSNGKYDTCRVTVKPSSKVDLAVPEVDYEYGPMTVTNYYRDGRVMNYNSISSLVFTKIERTSSGDDYKLSVSIQGYTDYDKCLVYLYFYDAGGRVLAQELLIEDVASNQDYNVLVTKYIDAAVLDEAVKVEFYSHDGHPAESGASKPDPEPEPEPDTGSEPWPDYGYDTYYDFDGIPEFDQFTSSSRTQTKDTTNVDHYLYASATQSEVDAYVAALEECDFTVSNIAGMPFASKGTSGDDNYREVRISVSASPYGELAVGIIISKIRPSNEW